MVVVHRKVANERTGMLALKPGESRYLDWVCDSLIGEAAGFLPRTSQELEPKRGRSESQTRKSPAPGGVCV